MLLPAIGEAGHQQDGRNALLDERIMVGSEKIASSGIGSGDSDHVHDRSGRGGRPWRSSNDRPERDDVGEIG